ncbi:MAG: phosphatidylglycerophosphatase A [Planctomycetota bacterium]|nr:MAG: phosphatidylglycerophosphatase A [Planctomycetota bacterium]
MRDALNVLIVTVGGLGLIRRAPGTWGSVPPAALALAFMLSRAPTRATLAALVVVGVLTSALCVRLTPWAERRFGRADPRQIVLDEVAGQALALIPVALMAPASVGATVAGVLAAFALFRIFDIAKFGLIDTAQRLPRGLGVLMDDLVAGAAAGGLVWVGWKVIG